MEFTMGLVLAVLGAALSVAGPGVGSALGVSMVGKASSGVITEDPEKFSKLLILEAVPGTQGIYGFIAGFMIIMAIGSAGTISTNAGLSILLAAMPVSVVGLFSAVYQARVCMGGVAVVAKRPEELGKSIILAAMVETYAILGLLATILLLRSIQLTG